MRTAAVSGGSSGIGRAIVGAFLDEGWKVAFGARRIDVVGKVVAELGRSQDEVYGGPLDVTEPASIDSFYDVATRALGPIDLIVNCAAHASPGALWERSPEQIRSEIEAGLTGALLFSRRGVMDLVGRKTRGDVIFLSSTSAQSPWPFLATYAASKAGLEQAARSISLELEGTGVRSTVVRIGNTLGTGWADDWDDDALGTSARWQSLGLIRHEGFLRPDDVARAVVKVVSTPPGVQLDHVSVHPEAPSKG